MKKTRLLPLLLAFPLLTSCGLSKMKAPKFAKYENEVSYKNFSKSVLKAMESADFAQEKTLPSGILKENSGSYYETEHKRDKKQMFIKKSSSLEELDVKADFSNKLTSIHWKEETQEAYKDSYGQNAKNTVDKEDSSYQEAQIDGVNYLLIVNTNRKEYQAVQHVNKDNKTVDFMDELIKDEFYSVTVGFSVLLGSYEAADAEAKKDFSFYKDDNVYTIAIERETVDELKDGNGKQIFKATSKVKLIYQVDFTRGKFKSVYFSETESTKEYKQEFDDGEFDVYAAKGDTIRSLSQISNVISYEYKDVKLKAVDISKYTKIGLFD